MGNFETISTLPAGFLLGGRYEIQRVIGQGGMGIVYLALDKQLNDSPRAIKTIKPEQMLDKRGFAQFKQEAQASISLTHQNIVRVINYEESEGLAYIVMEYVSGSTLEELLLEKGRLTVEEFLPIARQICNALDYSHKKKIIHRDIKPSNIFLTDEGEVKLADFGIARVMKDSQTRMTGRMTPGTLVYMPPEVILGSKADERADIYSLGITFYEMLAGQPPFVSGDIGLQHRERKPDPIEGIPVELNNAVLVALEKNPVDRPSSVAEYWNLIGGEAELRKRAEEEHRKNEEELQRSREEEQKARTKAVRREREEEERRKLEKEERRIEEREAEDRRRRQVVRPPEKAEGKSIWSRTGFWVAVVFAFILILVIAFSFLMREIITESSVARTADERTSGDNLIVDLGSGIELQLQRISAGSFMMGASPGDIEADSDEAPQHRVEITKAFCIGIYEVTQAQYEAVMGKNPSFFKGSRMPVERVSWNDAVEFCRKLSQKEGVTYRLPTESEWEYACRAGSKTRYYWGNSMDSYYAWYDGNSGGQTHEVGSKLPNGWDLHDMSGNVWEWCQDWYDENYYSRSPSRDPAGPSSGQYRVLRGGSWLGRARKVRSSVRYYGDSDYRNNNGGFRIVRDVE